MILLMPCELELKSGGRVWGTVRAEVSPTGEVLSVLIKTRGAPTWRPFCKMTVVDLPGVGEQLAFSLFGGAEQKGEMDEHGRITLDRDKATG